MAVKQGTGKIPKYISVSDAIRKRIQNGVWQPGEQLPPARVFAEEFEVTPVTVWKALDELGKEHLTHRVQGKGSFVSTPAKQHQTAGTFGILMSTEGHCYGKMFTYLVHSIAERGGFTSVGSISLTSAFSRIERQARLEHFLQREVDGMIADSIHWMPIDMLEGRWPGGRGLTFIHRYEKRERLPDANYILTAWDDGGEMAARHLLERGVDHVILFTFNGEHRTSPPGMGGDIHYHWGVRHGIERAIAAHGGDPDRDLGVIVDTGDQRTDDALRDTLSHGRPGVICMSDHRAMSVYRVAGELGCRIGRDALVTGFFDTPWADAMTPALTSVNIQEARLAELAAESAVDNWHGRRLTVAPKLAPRQSTGDEAYEATRNTTYQTEVA